MAKGGSFIGISSIGKTESEATNGENAISEHAKLTVGKTSPGLGKEPLLDSLRTVFGFLHQTKQLSDGKTERELLHIDKVQEQLNISQQIGRAHV